MTRAERDAEGFAGPDDADDVDGLGRVELMADLDRPGGWLLLVDRIRQSYVDLDDPGYLDFEYVQAFADVLDSLPQRPLAVTHVGGGGCTLARWVAFTRPGSSQIVLEPDAALIELVRARLPLPRRERIRIRPVDGRSGVAALRDASADAMVIDAFHGGRVPTSLTTIEFVGDAARVLRPAGVLMLNVADVRPFPYARRVIATVRAVLPHLVIVTDPAVLKGRRFGNIVIAASRAPLAGHEIRTASARAAFPRSVVTRLGGDDRVLTDADPMRSPAPPDELWRVQ